MNHRSSIIRLTILLLALILLGACASIGRPQGGAKDENPPVFVRSNPAPGTLNFDKNKLNIYFDENIKLEDALNKVVVSPVQQNPPRVSANGRHLTVEFQDTLLPDATYTVDFSDAVRDLNEGNILDGFAIDFSTGANRDSLVIAGMLFEARTLEPAQGMLVGVHSNLADSALTTLRFDRIAKTDQYGRFIIRNLAPGAYNLFAVNDVNRDYRWDRSEDVAFFATPIVPTVENISVTDTLRAANGSDSILSRQGVRYLPNDILLTWFNENYKAQYLRNNSRPDSTRVIIEMGAPADSLPILTLLNTPSAGRTLNDLALIEHSADRDSVTFWITDPAIIATDTLVVAARHQQTDSLSRLVWQTDTLRLIHRHNASQPAKKTNKKKNRADSISDSIPPLKFLDFKILGTKTQELNKPLRMKAPEPLATVDPSKIRLLIKRDTLWIPLKGASIVRDSANRLLDYSLHYDWEPGATYRFIVDSAAVTGIYGLWNDSVATEFTTKLPEDYCTVSFKLAGYDPNLPVMVELLNNTEKVIDRQPVVNGEATFTFVDPATYYARAFIDSNDNGVWDTGNIADKIQPEDVYYYPKKIAVKKNWDLTQTWNISELPLDLQKPSDIKKNKPKTKEPEVTDSYDDEEEEDDDFYNPSFGNRGNNNGKNNRSRNNNRNSSGLKNSRPNIR